MNNNQQARADDIITITKGDIHFAAAIKKTSAVDFNRCLHCRCCAGGCPFFHAMDYAPHEVIRLVQLGMKKQAMGCSTIWICVGCHTCTVQCPMAIDISAVMDAVGQTALLEGNHIAEPDVTQLHKAVLRSIERYGRTHKLEIMLRYKVQKRDWLKDLDVGLKMLKKRKLDLLPSKVKNIDAVKKLFS
jgi:heterodisulfide reductase subunit C